MLKTCKPNTVKLRLGYAKRYANCPPVEISQLPPQTRHNVQKSLTALSKYLGCYDQFRELMKRYNNLKWTTGSESITSLQRFFNPNLTLDSMLRRVKQMMRMLPEDMALVVRHALLTGFKPSEACESVRLINGHMARHGYYNQGSNA